MLLRLRTPATNERGPLYAEQAFSNIHQANVGRLPIRLIFATQGGTVGLFIETPDVLKSIVQEQLYAFYPDCILDRMPADALHQPPGFEMVAIDLVLSPELFPCRRYAQFEDAINRVTADPLMGILNTLAQLDREGFQGRIELVVCPARHRRPARARRCLHRLNHPFFRSKPRLSHFYARVAMSPRIAFRLVGSIIALPARSAGDHPMHNALNVSGSRLHEREEDLQAASDKLGRLLFETRLRVTVLAVPSRKKDAHRRLHELAGSLGHFNAPRTAAFHAVHRRSATRLASNFLLSTEELASLFHPPNQTVRTPNLAQVASRELAPPANLRLLGERPNTVTIGRTQFRSQQDGVSLAIDDRRRHLFITGKSGCGKTTLNQNLLAADIAAGHGVACIDPHGDLADLLLELIPRHRTNEVVVFDVGDAAHPLPFNLLVCNDIAQRPLVASGILSAFKKIYGSSWGPRLEHVLRNSLLALLEIPGSSLVQMLPLLTDAAYRKLVVKRLQDAAVRRFWEQEFAGMPSRLQAEAISPVLNKVGHFISSPLLRNILGQAKSTLDLREVMDEGKILLVNLSKGRIGDDASGLLGALLVTALQLAAMARAEQPEEERRDFFAYVDEFSNFATESFASIFSEARKYRLGLTVATQFTDQFDEFTRASVFGNVGTLIAFQSSQRDAEILAKELGGDLQPADLLKLPKHQAYVRLLVDGMPSNPISVRTLPPVKADGDSQLSEIVRRTSRHRYGRSLREVEREIALAFA